MKYLRRIKAILIRLIAAVRRRGVLRVAAMMMIVLRGVGPRTALGLVAAGRPLPHAGDDRIGQPHPILERIGQAAVNDDAADLDGDYMMRSADWARWRKVIGVHPPSPDPKDERFKPARVAIVVRDNGNAEAMEKTRAAVRRLGSHAEILAPGDEAPTDGAFLLFLEAGDAPFKELPLELARAALGGVAEVISFDMIRRVDDKVQPLFMPGANPTMLRQVDYLFSRIAVRGAALPKGSVGGADPRALVLAWTEGRPAAQVRGRWRHAARPLLDAEITDADVAERRDQARGSAPPPRAPGGKGATVVICNKDKGNLLRQLVRSLLLADRSLVEEVVIVANGTTNFYALQAQEDLARSPRVHLLRDDGPFNFSRLTNAGVRLGKGDGPILFLNDDIVPVSEDWLERMHARLDEPDVACVGPLLLYPDETVQHAGMFMGGGWVHHTMKRARLPDEDYMFQASAAREISVVTGAVLLTRRSVFEAMNGLDEKLALHVQDVDYCLRASASGLRNVFDPGSVLFHVESASIHSLEGDFDFRRNRFIERNLFGRRWNGLRQADPFHPAGFMDDRFRRLSGPAGERPKPRGRVDETQA